MLHLGAELRLWSGRNNRPVCCHMKTMVIDGALAILGSQNWSDHSATSCIECVCITQYLSVVAPLFTEHHRMSAECEFVSQRKADVLRNRAMGGKASDCPKFRNDAERPAFEVAAMEQQVDPELRMGLRLDAEGAPIPCSYRRPTATGDVIVTMNLWQNVAFNPAPSYQSLADNVRVRSLLRNIQRSEIAVDSLSPQQLLDRARKQIAAWAPAPPNPQLPGRALRATEGDGATPEGSLTEIEYMHPWDEDERIHMSPLSRLLRRRGRRDPRGKKSQQVSIGVQVELGSLSADDSSLPQRASGSSSVQRSGYADYNFRAPNIRDVPPGPPPRGSHSLDLKHAGSIAVGSSGSGVSDDISGSPHDDDSSLTHRAGVSFRATTASSSSGIHMPIGIRSPHDDDSSLPHRAGASPHDIADSKFREELTRRTNFGISTVTRLLDDCQAAPQLTQQRLQETQEKQVAMEKVIALLTRKLTDQTQLLRDYAAVEPVFPRRAASSLADPLLQHGTPRGRSSDGVSPRRELNRMSAAVSSQGTRCARDHSRSR